ncbi:MAG: cyanophycinase [Bacteroides sp.]|jgi:cyanophycinase|nr:cyanophycinase [Bacteroides sp.]
MRILILFFSVLFLMASCQSPETGNEDVSEAPKGSLFIIGGGSRPDAMVQRMVTESGVDQTGYVVILPMASSEPDSAILWSAQQFLDNGVSPVVGFNFLPGMIPGEARLDSLRKASLIYISGGDQNRFMDIVRGTPIADAIHEAYLSGALIAGTSAGAALMSGKMITGTELKYPDYRPTFRSLESNNLELEPGLGLIHTAIVDQHFVWRSRHNRLLSAILEYPDLLGIGIDESTALLVKGNSAEVIGLSQVMVYANPLKKVNNINGKLGATGLTLDIYLPGEKFSLK